MRLDFNISKEEIVALPEQGDAIVVRVSQDVFVRAGMKVGVNGKMREVLAVDQRRAPAIGHAFRELALLLKSF